MVVLILNAKAKASSVLFSQQNRAWRKRALFWPFDKGLLLEERFQYLFLEKFSRLVNKWQKQDFQECARLAKGFSSWRLVRKEDVECLYVTSVLEAFCIMEKNFLLPDAERRAFLFEYVWYAFMDHEIPADLIERLIGESEGCTGADCRSVIHWIRGEFRMRSLEKPIAESVDDSDSSEEMELDLFSE